MGRTANSSVPMTQNPYGKNGAGSDESVDSSTCPTKVMRMAMRLAPMYRKPTEASSGTGYEHSTVATIVAGTAPTYNKASAS